MADFKTVYCIHLSICSHEARVMMDLWSWRLTVKGCCEWDQCIWNRLLWWKRVKDRELWEFWINETEEYKKMKALKKTRRKYKNFSLSWSSILFVPVSLRSEGVLSKVTVSLPWNTRATATSATEGPQDRLKINTHTYTHTHPELSLQIICSTSLVLYHAVQHYSSDISSLVYILIHHSLPQSEISMWKQQ